MAFRAIERVGPARRTADVAILTGDLTNFGEPEDAWRVIDAVRAHCPEVWAVTGNLDMLWVIDALRARGVSLHGEGRRVGDLGVFGCGGSNITPMDTPTEFEEDELLAILERGHAAVADAPRRLMICHTPPPRPRAPPAFDDLHHAPLRHPTRPPDERHARRKPRRAPFHRDTPPAGVRR